MSHWTGRVVPAKRLCRLVRDSRTLTVVDGAQTFAQMPVSFRDLDCDFFVTSLHKRMGAAVGNGMLVVREGVIGRTWPLLAPFDPPPLRVDEFDHWYLGTYNSGPAGRHPAGGALPPGDRGPGRPRACTGADPVLGGARRRDPRLQAAHAAGHGDPGSGEPLLRRCLSTTSARASTKRSSSLSRM
ncbi:aminotransferase class V-fold PLP-dependent enzyme [Streptomyces paradoxus]|uniref:aminotransferase class V-fold PLP-dependent enzyme n=1 Tax=Streptomyces paradoxus TaxID=66375 RepID=UPI00364421B8